MEHALPLEEQARAELIASGGAKTQSFDPATGKLLWELKANGRSSVTPVGDAELLFVDSVDRLMGIRGSITAIRPGASGDISLPAGQTSSDFVAWTLPLNLPRIASPILLSDCLLVLAQQNASATCLDAKTGKQLYSQRLPQAKGFTASPIAADGRIYCLDERGLTLILKPGPDFNSSPQTPSTAKPSGPPQPHSPTPSSSAEPTTSTASPSHSSTISGVHVFFPALAGIHFPVPESSRCPHHDLPRGTHLPLIECPYSEILCAFGALREEINRYNP